MLENRFAPFPGFRPLIIILLLLGIFFRVNHLDYKLFDGDECITAVRAAGYSGELINATLKDKVVAPKDIDRFRQIASDTSWVDTIKVTAQGAPQHTPLYFVLTRFWMQWFGSSAAAIKSFTVLTSLLVFPAVYWLALELFESSTAAWLSMGVIAVSPIHLFYAQNARPRTLWILMILLSSAALLRAIRLNKRQDWILYGITLGLHFYTFLFSGFVAIAHGLYAALRDYPTRSKQFKPYLLTTSFALFSFIPWIIVVTTNFSTAKEMTSWTNFSAPFLPLLGVWGKNLCDLFVFWHDVYEKRLFLSEENFIIYFGFVSLLFVLYAFYVVCRQAPKKVWLFILLLPGVTAMALVLTDFALGGIRSALSRYLFPCILGIQLAITYLLTVKSTDVPNPFRLKLWRVVIAGILSLGVISGVVNTQTETWNGKDDFIIESARVINQASQPIVITDGDLIFDVMPLNYRLTDNVRVLVPSQSTNFPIPTGFSDVFIFAASEELQTYLAKQTETTLKPAYQDFYLNVFLWKATSPKTLWKIESPNV